MADDDAASVEKSRSLPWHDRIADANWKVRCAAYEDIKLGCDRVFDESDPVLNEYASLLPKAVADGNAAALDKGLDALLSFLAKANEQHATRICERTCNNMVSKCLGGRPGTVSRASDAFLFFIELGQIEKVLETLIAGLTNKVPKVVLACLDVLIKSVGLFGAKVVPPQQILKALPSLFDSKDGKAREKVKELVVEIARWVGADLIKTLLFEKMRDAMKDDIGKAMQEVCGQRPRPERLTKKDQAKQMTENPADLSSQGASASGVQAASQKEPMDEEADPYDFVDPKDVLSELRKDFWEGLESKKWNERKNSLSHLKALASHPRLQSGDYGDVNRELRKTITKDSNVVVVTEAIQCLAALASGLRKEYASAARNVVDVLLEKFKEKNGGICRASADALTAMNKYCMGLLDITEDITAALQHQNPKVREEALKWLSEVIPREPKQSFQKLCAAILPAVVKCADEPTPTLREAALSTLVVFILKSGSASALDKYTSKIDEARRKKLDEMLAEARGSPSQPVQPAVQAVRASISALPAEPVAKAAKATVSAVRSSTTSSLSAPKAPAKRAAANDAEDEGSLSAGTFTKDDVIQKFSDLFGEGVVNQLQAPDWKARLEAIERIASMAAGLAHGNASLLIQGVGHIPGWDDKNFQVNTKVFEVVQAVVSQETAISKRDAYAALTGAVEKIADIKLKGPAFDTLLSLSEAVGPQFICTHIHKKAAAHKNPKVLSEALNFITQAIESFGLHLFTVKDLLDWVKEDLGSANAGVRTSATHLMGVMHRFVGSALGDMVRADVKPALMTAIESEFSRNPQQSDFAPTRTCRLETKAAAAKGAGGKGSKGAAAAAAAAVFDADELLPRQDISNSISSALLTKMSSANWKERQEGLEEVEQLIVSAGNRIQPQTGDLLGALKLRLQDSNKNLAAQAVTLVGKLAKAMGKPIAREARPLLGPALRNISDVKSYVRAAVIDMLDAWMSVASADILLNEVYEAMTHAKCGPEGKRLALTWITSVAAAGKTSEGLGDALLACASGMADKAVEVRDAAGKLFTALTEAHGAGELHQAAASIESSSRKAVIDMITKAGIAAPVATARTGTMTPSAPAPLTRAPSTRVATSTAVRSSTTSLNGTRKTGTGAGASVLRSSMASSVSGMPQSDGPLLQLDNKKEERARKHKFKPAKFEMRPDEGITLEGELAPLLGGALRATMFSKDFKRHCEAADMLKEGVITCYEEEVSQLDLLLRWCALRIVDANTQVLVKVLEFLKVLFDALIENGYKLTEYESKVFLPALVEKAGHNQDKIKADHRELMKKACAVFPSFKVLLFVKDGLESKNNKTKVVCADEICAIIDREGFPVYQGRPPVLEALMAVARLVAERDNALRGAVLSAMEMLYLFEGDGIWKLLGRLTDQQHSLIEERLKSVDKQLARAGLRAGYRTIELQEAMEAAEEEQRRSMAAEAAGDMEGPETTPASPASWSSPNSQQSANGIASPAVRGSPTTNVTRSIPGVASHPLYDSPQQQDNPSISQAAKLLHSIENIPTKGLPGLRIKDNDVSTSDKNFDTSLKKESSLGGPVTPHAPPAQQLGPYMSPAVMGLNRTSESATRQHLASIIRTLSSGDIDRNVEVVKLLCYELLDNVPKDAALCAIFDEQLDEMVMLLSQMTDRIFTSASEPDYPSASPRAAKYCLNCLMAVLSCQLAQRIRIPAITQLISMLLCCIVDEQRIQSMHDYSNEWLRAVNMMMIKMLENADRTVVYIVLLRAMLEIPPRLKELDASKQIEARWVDTVVKCLIKVTKTMNKCVDSVDLPGLLVALHDFFTTLGPEELRRRSSTDDKPLRMVKTILYEMCKIKGMAIYNYTFKLPPDGSNPRPVIYPYIELNINALRVANQLPPGDPPSNMTIGVSIANASRINEQSMQAAASQVPQPNISTTSQVLAATAARLTQAQALAAQSTTQPSTVQATSFKMPQASDPLYLRRNLDETTVRDAVTHFFQRLARKEDMEQICVDLHYLAFNNPHIDINPMIATASPQLRYFLARGLSKVKQRLAQETSATQPAASLPQPVVTSSLPLVSSVPNGASTASPTTVEHSVSSPVGRSRGGLENLNDLRDRLQNMQADISRMGATRMSFNTTSIQDLHERVRRLKIEPTENQGT